MSVLMIEGDTESRYATKHALTAAAAVACVRFGWTRTQYLAALLDAPSTAGHHARNIRNRNGYDRTCKYLDRVWARAQALVGGSVIVDSRFGAVTDLIALRDRIVSAVWRGTSDSTAMRVLLAHWQAAKRAGGRVYTLSYREAAEAAGCGLHTAWLATRRLGDWLRLVKSGRGEADKGSKWMLLDGPSHARHTARGAQPPGSSNVSSVRNGELDGAVVLALMPLDAFAHRGLGSSCLKLLAALSMRDRQSAAELVDTAMVSLATAYRQLKRLGTHGLVVKEGTLWRLSQGAVEALTASWPGWNAIAAQEETYGTAWRRLQAHKDQRANWRRLFLDRIAVRRMPDVEPQRGDEVRPEWVRDGMAVDPVTGQILPDIVVASDGRFMVVHPEPIYEEQGRRARHTEAACAS